MRKLLLVPGIYLMLTILIAALFPNTAHGNSSSATSEPRSSRNIELTLTIESGKQIRTLTAVTANNKLSVSADDRADGTGELSFRAEVESCEGRAVVVRYWLATKDRLRAGEPPRRFDLDGSASLEEKHPVTIAHFGEQTFRLELRGE